MNLLLTDAGQLKTIILVALCVLLALTLLYGILKKFSRISWLGWQAALLFGATFTLSLLPESLNETVLFAVAAGGLLAVTAIIFLVGALVRKSFLAMEQGGGGARAFNRILGALTALVNLAVLVLALGGFALVVAEPFAGEALAAVYTNTLWTNFFAWHAYDLFFVFLFAAVLRSAYRTGFLRIIITITVLALTLFAVFLAMYMTLQVPFLSQLSAQIAGSININSIAAGWIGFGIVSFIVAFVLFLVVILIAFLLNLLLRLCGKSHVFVVFDGILFSLITCIVMFVFVAGFNFGVSYLASGSLAQAVPEQMAGVAEQMAQFAQAMGRVLSSSPLSNIFYTHNPLNLLIAR